MKITKAIELLKQCEYSLRTGKKIDHADAAKLGIEALKRLTENRSYHFLPSLKLLPGEDPE